MAGCHEVDIYSLLPWFVAGTLTGAEKAKVEAHLKTCTFCRERIRHIQWLAQGMKKYGGGWETEHVPSEQLVLYAEARNELKKEEVEFIEQHLQRCQSCRKELDILQRVNNSLEVTARPADIRFPLWETIRDKLASFLARPAIAYALVLILLVPAWFGILYFKRELSETRQPQVAEINYQLAPFDARSGAELENIVKVDPEARIFSLSFNIPILDQENIRYDAIILNTERDTVWQQRGIRSLDEYGTFLLVCHTQFFSEGNYLLKILEVNTESDSLQDEFDFSFTIVKEE